MTVLIGTIAIKLHLHSGTFDFPAQASFLNVTQYNGQFGCLFCDNAGVRIQSGQVTCQTYPYNADSKCITANEFKLYVHGAANGNTRIFDIK